METSQVGHSAAEVHFEGEAKRHFRYNFVLHTTEWAFGIFAFACVAPATIMPMYLKALGASNFLVGLASVMLQASYSISMLFVAYLVQRHRTRKWPAVVYGIPTRLVLAIFGVTALATERYGPAVGIWGMFGGLILMMTTAGACELAWSDLISRVVPQDRRGWFHGVRQVVAVVVGVLAAWLVTLMIGDGDQPDPASFGWPFLIGAGTFVITLPLVAMTREPLHQDQPPRAKGYWAYLGEAVAVLRRDALFRRYVLVQMASAPAWLFGPALFAAYARDGFDIAPQTVTGPFTTVMLVCMAVTGPLLGRLADRRGYKMVFAFAVGSITMASVTGLTLQWWPWPVVGIGLCYALAGVAGTAMFMATFNMTFEFAGVHSRSLYIAISATSAMPVYLVAGGLGGALVDLMGFLPVLAISAALGSAAVVVGPVEAL